MLIQKNFLFQFFITTQLFGRIQTKRTFIAELECSSNIYKISFTENLLKREVLLDPC